MSDNNYKATIITPFHNTDISIFSETIKSVKKQTIGFENIEWIIVLHNCEQFYIDEVRGLLGKYDNVYLKELNNDAKSAASPRNYALDFVTSPYIEFLDSDDRINEKTVETCIEEMEKHDADMIVFRMAYVRQNESVQALLTDVTLFNPMEKEIVLTGEGLRCKELFSAFGALMTHNRFTKTEFIQSNNIRFDEEVTMAEDAYFTLVCYSKINKIVILPQFVGHYYFVNSASAVQSMIKPAKDVLHFSYGFKKMFDLLIDIKAYYNHYILLMLQLYLNYAYLSPDFDDEAWTTLRKDMAPYAKLLTPPPVNKLFPTVEEGEKTYQFVIKGILDYSKEDEVAHFNGDEILRYIIRCNKDTAFGKYYNFEDIKSIEEFRDKVVLYDHKRLDELIRLYTEVGESEILTSKKIAAYAYDFNESSDMRMIPIVGEVSEQMGKHFIGEISGETTFLMMECIPKGMSLNDGTYADSVVGIMVRSGIERFSLTSRGQEGYFTSPFSLIFPSTEIDSMYINLLLALRNDEVTQIFGANTWIVSNYLDMLIDKKDMLCRDIEKGRISGISGDNHIYHEISAWNTPDPKRARALKKALKCDDVSAIIKMIWPNLKRILVRSGGNFDFYTKRLRKYIKDVRIELDEFVTPFGIIAEKTENENIFKLNTENAFYEFLSAEEEELADAKLVSELECGNIYEMVLTNNSGIYRMRTNIFIRPTDISKEGVLFEECMKPLIVKGKLFCTGNEFEEILEDVIGDMLHDYFFFYDDEKRRLDIMIEPERESKREDYSKEVEERLLENDLYKEAIENGMNMCNVRVIDKGIRELWRDIRREKYHAPVECFHPIHYIEEKTQIEALKRLNLKD